MRAKHRSHISGVRRFLASPAGKGYIDILAEQSKQLLRKLRKEQKDVSDKP